MKKYKRLARLGLAAAAVCGLLLLPMSAPKMDVQAAEVIATVQGSVMEKTTAKLLYLNTESGKMEIKIDGDTNTGSCKMLLPDKKISVSVAHGNDGYLHAVTISESGENPGVTLDTTKISNVIGTVNQKTTENVLYLDTEQGEMEIKLDRDTDFSSCSVLVVSENMWSDVREGKMLICTLSASRMWGLLPRQLHRRQTRPLRPTGRRRLSM